MRTVYRYLSAALLAASFCVGLPELAFAEGATIAASAETYTINLRPLVSELVQPIAAAIGIVLATWISTRLAGWLKLQRDDGLRGVIDNVMQKGLAYGMSKLDDATKSAPLTFEVKNRIVADAANYAIAAAPDAMKKLGVTKDTIEKAVAARLELVVNPSLPTPQL